MSVVLFLHASADLYGSDRALLESVRAVRGAGHRAVVGLPRPGPLAKLLTDVGAEVSVVPMLVLRKGDMSPLGLLRVLRTTLMVLPANVRLLRSVRPHLLYVNTVAVPMWLPLGRLFRVRSVCHVHEAEEGLSAVVSFVLTMPLTAAQLLVVNSRHAAEVLLRTAPRLCDKVTVVYNGVPGPPSPAQSLPDVPSRPLRLLLVGRWSSRKGTDVAVAAVGELRRRGVDVTLRLVGSPGPNQEAFVAALASSVGEASVRDAVLFDGFHEDVWPVLADCDIALVPSRMEPFGNVAVEAALARRPVVASKVQGLREIVQHGVTGLLVPPQDPQALAAAVEELMSDWPGARRLGEAAATAAELRFGVARYGRELLETLQIPVDDMACGTETP